MSKPIFFIDVSHHQGVVDVPKVQNSGITGIIAKVTESTNFQDPLGLATITATLRAGGWAAAYHFLHDGNGTAQADYFLNRIPRTLWNRILMAVDVEMYGYKVTASYQTVVDFVGRVRDRASGHPVVLYTGRDMWPGGDGSKLGPLWVAGYKPNTYRVGNGTVGEIYATVPAGSDGGTPFGGWAGPTFMQFTDRATVKGIQGAVDGDVFFGTADTLRRLSGSVAPIDTPTVKEPEMFNVRIHPTTACIASLKADGKPVGQLLYVAGNNTLSAIPGPLLDAIVDSGAAYLEVERPAWDALTNLIAGN